jgi:hypothetical protein
LREAMAKPQEEGKEGENNKSFFPYLPYLL